MQKVKLQTQSFRQRVFEVVRGIPAGHVMTYKEVAQAAGSPGAARAVGNIMKGNFDPSIPCHRVIHSDGTLGAYNRGGEEKKRDLLRTENAI
jgi:O-6-methylguanine DNA methyltransferase